MYSSTIAPNAQQIVSRKDMLKMSKLRRRAMLVDELDQFEDDARATKPQPIADAAAPPRRAHALSLTNEP